MWQLLDIRTVVIAIIFWHLNFALYCRPGYVLQIRQSIAFCAVIIDCVLYCPHKRYCVKISVIIFTARDLSRMFTLSDISVYDFVHKNIELDAKFLGAILWNLRSVSSHDWLCMSAAKSRMLHAIKFVSWTLQHHNCTGSYKDQLEQYMEDNFFWKNAAVFDIKASWY